MSKQVKWTQKRIEYLKMLQEQGVNLLELSIVKSGQVSINALINAGHRYYGFGSHRDKKNGVITLTKAVSFTKPNGTRNRKRSRGNRVVEESIEEPSTPLATSVSNSDEEWANQMLVGFIIAQDKIKKLNDIIASLRAIGHDKLAVDIEYCVS